MSGVFGLIFAIMTGLFLPHNHTILGNSTQTTVNADVTVTSTPTQSEPTDTPTPIQSGPSVSPSPSASPSTELEDNDTDRDDNVTPFGWIVSQLAHARNLFRKEVDAHGHHHGND